MRPHPTRCPQTCESRTSHRRARASPLRHACEATACSCWWRPPQRYMKPHGDLHSRLRSPSQRRRQPHCARGPQEVGRARGCTRPGARKHVSHAPATLCSCLWRPPQRYLKPHGDLHSRLRALSQRRRQPHCAHGHQKVGRVRGCTRPGARKIVSHTTHTPTRETRSCLWRPPQHYIEAPRGTFTRVCVQHRSANASPPGVRP